MLNEEKVAAIIEEHLDAKFPRSCSCCGRRYSSLTELLRETTRLGRPIAINDSLGDGRPKARLATMSFANCACGTTISVSSSGMESGVLREMLRWAEAESARRDTTVDQLLAELREKIDRRRRRG